MESSSVPHRRPIRSTWPAAWIARLATMALVLAPMLPLAGPVRPASAQGDPCPEPNNGFNQACFIGPGAPVVQGFIGQPGDVDAYKFEVPHGLARVRIELRDLPASYDVHLFDNSSAFITEAVGGGAKVLDLPLIRGTYFLFVNSGAGQSDPGRPYTLDIRVAADQSSPGLAGDPCPEPNDDLGRGCSVQPGNVAFGVLNSSDDVDTYRFEVGESGSLVNARLGDDVPYDFTFEILDGDGTVRDRGGSEATVFSRLPAGPYFVRISREDDDPDRAAYALLVTVTAPVVAPSAARDDVCPEPNDQYDRACAIGTGGPAHGFISSPSDVDMYRFEVSGRDSWVHVELTDLPRAYDVEVQDGRRTFVASSNNADTFPEALDLALEPGEYFVLVFSTLAQSDNDRPYTLSLDMVPLSGRERPAARVLFADNFNAPGAHFSATASDDTHHVGYYDGEYLVRLHRSGSPERLEDQGQLGKLDLRDFQLDLDVRVTDLPTGCGGFAVNFRWQEGSSGYQIYVDTVNQGRRGVASLSRFDDGRNSDLTDWIESSAIRTGRQSNHVTIRADGSILSVAINGEPILSVRDNEYREGDVGLSAFTCDKPTEARFDNVIATPVR